MSIARFQPSVGIRMLNVECEHTGLLGKQVLKCASVYGGSGGYCLLFESRAVHSNHIRLIKEKRLLL